jgi:protein phosphatase
MKLRVGTASDIGKARERNEDAFLAVHPLYVVADGMGGHRGGDVASSIVVEELSKSDEDGMRLGERIREANRTVFERQAGDRSLAGMGTTVTAVVADAGTLRIGHVGDSRAYLLRNGDLRRLTEDHTLVGRMVDEGKISEEEAAGHPQRSILTRALGVDERVDVDEQSIDVRQGDRLLLCTDGLTSMMREESVLEILEGHRDPQETSEALVDAANRAGGLDNITVVVIDFEEGDGVEVLGASTSPGTAGTASSVAEPAAPTRPEGAEPPARRRHTTPPSRLRRRLVILIAGLVVLIVAGIVALKLYADSQWYVGVQNGHVAVYRGIPTTILGIHLSDPVHETAISASRAERLVPYRDLPKGITAGSREQADSIVATIRHDLAQQQKTQQRKSRQQKGGGG